MTTPFSASTSFQGYLYQCAYALVAGMQRLREFGAVTVRIECLDDVDFSMPGSPVELLQLKHHTGSNPASLSDASPDLWGSLRVWMSNVLAGQVPSDAQLFLITTANASAGSAAALLGTSNRNPESAMALLDQVVVDSKSVGSQTSYALWAGLQPSVRLDLLQRTVIVTSQPLLADLHALLLSEIRLARPSRADLVAERLWEWWYFRCVAHLVAPGSSILGQELLSQIEDIADALRDDNLPIDASFDVADPLDYDAHTFVRQLALMNESRDGVLQAVKDYFRAFTQRSRWEREDLLAVGELGRYEERLVEEWEIRFRHMRDSLGEGVSETTMTDGAKAIYRWVEAEARFHIRPRCTEPFLTRGSYHMLSDELRVGWHPDFEARLAALLEASTSE